MVTVVVDAENVRRSTWPNVSGDRLLELGLELALAPAGVAREHARAARGHGERPRLDVRADEADVLEYERGRLLHVVELRQHDDRGRLHRAADVDAGAGVDEVFQRRHRIHDLGLGRPVEHEPHRALVGVLGDEHDRAPEVRVEERRRGDQELAAERLVLVHPGIIRSIRR